MIDDFSNGRVVHDGMLARTLAARDGRYRWIMPVTWSGQVRLDKYIVDTSIAVQPDSVAILST